MFPLSLPLTAFFAASALSSPLGNGGPTSRDQAQSQTCSFIHGPFLAPNFPDPSLLKVGNTYYSFATHPGKDVQMAKSTDFSSKWDRVSEPQILEIDQAPWAGKAKSGSYEIWAPDVGQQQHGSKKYIMYFAALDKENTENHCIGAATSSSITGPYTPSTTPLDCDRKQAGVMDPAFFRDPGTKKTYLVYKTEIPAEYNSLSIRELSSADDGSEGLEWPDRSAATQLVKVNSPAGFSDGNNIEDPFLFKHKDTYFLLFSTHFTGDGTYNVEYAHSSTVDGDYTRVKDPLFSTGMMGCDNIIGPGGASFVVDGDSVRVIFHSLTAEKTISKRVAYTATVKVDGNTLSVDTSG
ncbi:Uu.00g029170.m01.CDS01 [Anthostomella pinea]|uniref:Endo-1,5-alpha-L-arabinanase A n=1 Tax=Anthostomella pinea TaxID=933095 RepID=A0AAI8V7X5_9PEZI|nr:Uu.00g029170.m01.CDS01 [Anthostomella pinea]